MSTTKDAMDPFLNKRQTVPSVFLNELSENDRRSYNMAKGLISGGFSGMKVPGFIPQSTLADPFNQLNSPHSIRSNH